MYAFPFITLKLPVSDVFSRYCYCVVSIILCDKVPYRIIRKHLALYDRSFTLIFITNVADLDSGSGVFLSVVDPHRFQKRTRIQVFVPMR